MTQSQNNKISNEDSAILSNQPIVPSDEHNNSNSKTADGHENSDTTSADEQDNSISLHRVHRHHDDKKMIVTSSGKIKYVKKRSRRKTKKTAKRVGIGILIFIFVVAIGIFSAYSIKRHLGKKEIANSKKDAKITAIEDAVSEDSGQTITYNDKTYVLNNDLISVVFLGVDKTLSDSSNIGEAGQADAIYILTYDTSSKKCKIIPVSRESMVDVQLYSGNNEAIGMEQMQLCLAYAYGSDEKTSAENTISSLSKLFYNIPFDSYITLDWNAIVPLTDAIGGVKLSILEDVPAHNPIFRKGEKVTLSGEDAFTYVRSRDMESIDSNNDRLARQKQFLTSYLSQFITKTKKKPSTVTKLLDVADEYMYTNLSSNKIIYMASEILPNINDIADIEFLSIQGETKQGDVYTEFYPDETNLYETILNVFYKEVQ